MTEHTDKDPNDPRNQAAVQIGDPNAKPKSPGYYNPPDPNFGVSRSGSNEIRTPEMVKKAEEIPDTRSDYDKKGQAGKAGKAGETEDDTDYESHTVPELREMAEARGIEIKSDARKDEIIEALKKG